MDFDRGILLLLVGILAVLSAMLVVPYVQFVVAAVLLAFVLEPVHRFVAPRLGQTVSAALVTTAGLLALVLPLVFVLALVAGDAMAFASDFQEIDADYERVEAWIADTTGREVDVQSTVESQAQSFAESLFGSALDIFGTLTHVLAGLGLFLFLVFFFVRDGPKLVAWIRTTSPMPAPVNDDLLDRLHDITRAVLAGHVLIAFIQGAIAGLGVAAVGISSAVFWTFVMIVLSLIPLVGSFLVWGPASLWLIATGDTLLGVALAVWGIVVVGFSDDYLRPVVVDRYAHVSPAIILVGVVGGLSVWGFMGLFVGPIVVAALKESVEVYAKYYGTEAEPTDDEQVDPDASGSGADGPRSASEQTGSGSDSPEQTGSEAGSSEQTESESAASEPAESERDDAGANGS